MKELSPWQRRTFLFTIYAAIQFLLLTVIAMWLYPGGTAVDPTTAGYDFFRNFFSDLGLQHSHSGVYQPLTAGLFFVALSTAGVALILFSVAFRAFFLASALGRWLGYGAIFSGVVSGLGYLLVALTPADLRPEGHMFGVYVAFLAFPLSAAAYALNIYRQPRFPNRYGHILLAFTALLLIYLGFLFWGPGLDSPTGLIIQATAQKVIAYAAIFSLLLTAYGAWQQSEPLKE